MGGCLGWPFLCFNSFSILRTVRKLCEVGNKAAGDNVLYHKCRCGAKIPQGMAVCERCEAEENKRGKTRHDLYNEYRRDKRKAAFYVSPEWRRKRAEVIAKYNNIDIYAFYELRRIETADMVHHIIPIEEDWEQRLDANNLIPLSNKNHGIIEAMYKDNAKREATKALLFGLKKRYEETGGA